MSMKENSLVSRDSTITSDASWVGSSTGRGDDGGREALARAPSRPAEIRSNSDLQGGSMMVLEMASKIISVEAVAFDEVAAL